MRNPHLPYVVLVGLACFFGLLVWLDSPTAYTQDEPTTILQLTNQHVDIVSSHPSGFTELNDAAYFGLASEKGGLWKTDGTAQGTVLVKDVDVVSASLERIGDLLYFVVQDSNYNSALWRSDGTAEGTVLLKADLDIYPYTYAAIGTTVYFAAYDPIHGRELWKSDGTPEGTTLVADLTSGQGSSYFAQLVATDDVVYFTGYGEPSGYTLWQSDGTAEGTAPVAEAPDSPNSLRVMQNTLYFTGYTETYGKELWRYGAGEPSPSLVSDIVSGTQSSSIENLLVVNDRLFFVVSYSQLWQSDGTATGTYLVKDISRESGFSINNLTAVDNLLYFTVRTAELSAELWKSDGTAEGTLLVTDIALGTDSSSPRGLTGLNGQLYFGISMSQAEDSLWKSDGTADGTVAVANLTFDEYAGFFPTAIGNLLYFSAYDDEHGAELWVSDGTSPGTAFVAELDPAYIGPDFSDFVRVHNRLYFTTYIYDPFWWDAPKQLWLSEEATAPATLIDDELQYYQLQGAGDNLFITGYDATGPGLWKHSGGTDAPDLVKSFAEEAPSNVIALNDQIVFRASDQRNLDSPIYDLWRSDGTADGTIKLVEGTATSSAPTPKLVFQEKLFATRGNEIWLLDGTAEGVTHFVPEGLQGSITNMVSTPNTFYFSAVQETSPVTRTYTLWRSDGTSQGTSQLTFDQEIGSISDLFPVDNMLYVITYGNDFNRELWYNDGISQTVQHLNELAYSEDYSNYHWLTAAGGKLFFTADDGEHGPEVWKSDGTREGTILVKDIVPPELANVLSAYPGPLFAFGDLLYFGANDGSTGQELWRSDGSADRTILFKDINPGAGGSAPRNFIGHADRFFFSADDGVHGRELWQSDGTVEGTTLVTDLYLGAPSAGPFGRLIFSDTLYFTGNNGLDGQQLFELRTNIVPLALPSEEEPPPQGALPQPHQLFLPLVNR